MNDHFPHTDEELKMLRTPLPRRHWGEVLAAEKVTTLHEVLEACRGAHMDVCVCKELRRRSGGHFDFVGAYVDVYADPSVARIALEEIYHERYGP